MDINQPKWKIPEYSKREINEAGATIRKASVSEKERTAALKIVDNWRSAHAYPLHVFYMNLRGKASTKKIYSLQNVLSECYSSRRVSTLFYGYWRIYRTYYGLSAINASISYHYVARWLETTTGQHIFALDRIPVVGVRFFHHYVLLPPLPLSQIAHRKAESFPPCQCYL